MIQKFLDYISVEKRYSDHTVIGYRKDLIAFQEYLASRGKSNSIVDAKKKDIRGFLAFLSENDYSKRSINRKLSTLRSFYLFLLRIGEISSSPMEGVSSLKVYPKKQIPFSREEMDYLADISVNEDPDDQLGLLIVEVLYQTGMRRSELIGLRIGDVDFSQLQIKVYGKGGKERLIPIVEQFAETLRSYLEEVRPDIEDEDAFFLRSEGKKINEKFVYSRVKKYLSMVSSKEKISPHILRHSFATHVL